MGPHQSDTELEARDRQEVAASVRKDLKDMGNVSANTRELLVAALMCTRFERKSKIEGGGIKNFGLPEMVPVTRLEALRRAITAVPVEKLPITLAEISRTRFGQLVQSLLRLGEPEGSLDAPYQSLLLSLRHEGAPAELLAGAECLIHDPNTRFVSDDLGHVSGRFPTRFDRSVAEAAAAHFQNISDPAVFETMKKSGLRWWTISACMRLSEGRIRSCSRAPDEQVAFSKEQIPSAEPRASTRYHYLHLSEDMADLFTIQPRAEEMGDAIARVEFSLESADLIDAYRTFVLEYGSKLHVFTKEKVASEAVDELTFLAREDAELQKILYDFKKEAELLASAIFHRVDALGIPPFAQGPAQAPGTFTEIDAQNLRTFGQYLVLTSILLRESILDVSNVKSGAELFSLGLVDHSVFQSLLLSYLQKTFPYLFDQTAMPDGQQRNILQGIIQNLKNLGIQGNLESENFSTLMNAALEAQSFHFNQSWQEVQSVAFLCAMAYKSPDPIRRRRKPVPLPVPRPRLAYENIMTSNTGGVPPQIVMATDNPMFQTITVFQARDRLSMEMGMHRFDSNVVLSQLSVVPLSEQFPDDHPVVNFVEGFAVRHSIFFKDLLLMAEDCNLRGKFPLIAEKDVEVHLTRIVQGDAAIYGFVFSGEHAIQVGDMCAAEPLPQDFADMSVSFPPKETARYLFVNLFEEEADEPVERESSSIQYAIRGFLNQKSMWSIEQADEILKWAGIELSQQKGTHWEYEWQGHVRAIPSAALKSGSFRTSGLMGFLLGTHEIPGIGDLEALYEHIPERFKNDSEDETE